MGEREEGGMEDQIKVNLQRHAATYHAMFGDAYSINNSCYVEPISATVKILAFLNLRTMVGGAAKVFPSFLPRTFPG